ncbi:MAG: GC-type dockerin domain-anchored protein [Phycisphaerales bacterium]
MRAMIGSLVGLLLACVACQPCHAQDDPRVLYSTEFGLFVFTPIASALRDLGIDAEVAFTSRATRDDLLDGPWDLVIVRRTIRFEALYEAEILALLRDHVDAGRPLHFQMADLELVPDAWYDLLGLEGAVDLRLPLRRLDTIEPPRHPSMPFGGLPLWDELFPPDYGDELLPAIGSRGIIRYEDAGLSTVLSAGGRVLVNGQQWDNWVPADAVAAAQIRWLLRCPADLDLDGVLTLGDFLVFQNLFAVEDPSADVDGDGEFTIFDFLEFLNQLNAGC